MPTYTLIEATYNPDGDLIDSYYIYEDEKYDWLDLDQLAKYGLYEPSVDPWDNDQTDPDYTWISGTETYDDNDTTTVYSLHFKNITNSSLRRVYRYLRKY